MSKRKSSPISKAPKASPKALPAPKLGPMVPTVSQPTAAQKDGILDRADKSIPAATTTGKKRGRPSKATQTAPKAATAQGNGSTPHTLAAAVAAPSGVLLRIGDDTPLECGNLEAAVAAYNRLQRGAGGKQKNGFVYMGGTVIATIRQNGNAYDTTGNLLAAKPSAKEAAATPPAGKPVAEALEPAMAVSLPIRYINAALAIAAKRDESRPYLCALYLHQMEDLTLRLVATDSHRMLVTSTPGDRRLNWGKEGVLLPRVEIERIAKYCGKGEDVLVDISFGPKHPAVNIAEHLGMAQFTVTPVDHSFVDYQRLMIQAGDVIGSDEARVPADTTALNRDYLKAAGVVAAALESASVRPFVDPTGQRGTVFTFDDPGALLVVMPMRTDTPALRAPTMRILGADGMSRTLAALKAHETRCRKASAETKDKAEKAKLDGQAAKFAERISEIRAVVASLPAPAAPTSTDKPANAKPAEKEVARS